MRFSIIAVGRLKTGPERDLCARYSARIDRMGRSHGLGPIDFIEIMEDRASNASQRKLAEGRLLLDKSGDAGRRVALDEGGSLVTSAAFALSIEIARDNGIGSMAFLIGGPDGHDDGVIDACSHRLSLGRMTFPHGLARVVLVEQIYRALTLIAGHPYHRE